MLIYWLYGHTHTARIVGLHIKRIVLKNDIYLKVQNINKLHMVS